jgi:monovalent cation/proton antiporter MnhG/PhaG subunit
MTWREIVVTLLLAAGAGSNLLCSLAMLRFQDAYDRLHMVGAAAALGLLPACAAVWVVRGVSADSFKVLLLAACFLVTSAVLTSATAQAIRIRRQMLPRPRSRR